MWSRLVQFNPSLGFICRLVKCGGDGYILKGGPNLRGRRSQKRLLKGMKEPQTKRLQAPNVKRQQAWGRAAVEPWDGAERPLRDVYMLIINQLQRRQQQESFLHHLHYYCSTNVHYYSDVKEILPLRTSLQPCGWIHHSWFASQTSCVHFTLSSVRCPLIQWRTLCFIQQKTKEPSAVVGSSIFNYQITKFIQLVYIWKPERICFNLR